LSVHYLFFNWQNLLKMKWGKQNTIKSIYHLRYMKINSLFITWISLVVHCTCC
jgi:hypothetical protein